MYSPRSVPECTAGGRKLILFVPAARNRQSIRLRSYDYSRIGAYFVTLCTEERWCLLGAVTDGAMRLNDAGRMVEAVWHSLPNRFQAITIDAFVVMPNHIRGIIVISNDEDDRGGECRGDHKDRPTGGVGPAAVGANLVFAPAGAQTPPVLPMRVRTERCQGQLAASCRHSNP